MMIDYQLRKSRRARRMWLAVHCDGSVIVTLPFGMAPQAAAAFVDKKKEWLLKTIAKAAKYRDDIVLPRSRRDYARRKEEARILVRDCLERFNAAYGLTYGKVFIKNMRRNWGSCSEAGNLNFNYKIIYLPPHLADYLIVHELCHLGSFDHSPAYWTLVGRAIPDHEERRKELRRYRP